MKQHKWAKEIKAWADGAEIQYKVNGKWKSLSEPTWFDSNEYRIKPQEQQRGCCCKQTCSAPKEPQYLYVYDTKAGIRLKNEKTPYCYIGKIKLEQDDE